MEINLADDRGSIPHHSLNQKQTKNGNGIIQIKTSGNHRANPFDEVSPSSAANGKGKTENDCQARRRAERNGLGRRIHRIIKRIRTEKINPKHTRQ